MHWTLIEFSTAFKISAVINHSNIYLYIYKTIVSVIFKISIELKLHAFKFILYLYPIYAYLNKKKYIFNKYIFYNKYVSIYIYIYLYLIQQHWTFGSNFRGIIELVSSIQKLLNSKLRYPFMLWFQISYYNWCNNNSYCSERLVVTSRAL